MKKNVFPAIVSIIIIFTFLFVPFFSNAAVKGGLTMKADPSKSSMFRYWIAAAYPMDDEGGAERIEKELKEIADKGYAGIEVSTLKADYAYDTGKLWTYGWGSPKFVEMMKVILRAGNRLGLQIDITATNGWPIMVPGIMGTNAEERILYKGERTDVTGSSKAVLYSDKGKEYAGLEKPRYQRYLQAVTAVKVLGSAEVDKGVQRYQWGTDNVEGVKGNKDTTLLDSSSIIALTEGRDYTYNKETGAVTLNWNAPDSGNWRIFTYWMGFSGKSSSDLTEKEALYTNYFSRDGAKAFTDYWERTLLADRELADLVRNNGTRIFEDSIEFATYFGSSGYLGNMTLGIEWTEEFFSEFKKRAGYDLAPYLPLLDGQELGGTASVQYYDYEFGVRDENGRYVYSNIADRIRNDLQQVYTEMFIDNHLLPIQEWARSKGMGYRFQLYSYNWDTNYTSALVTTPEVETLGFSDMEHGYDKMRLVAGGAHMGNRAVVSDEAALTSGGYTLTYEGALKIINNHYALGANQILWHGFTHTSGVSSSWPGNAAFGSMLGDNWGPRQTSWESEKDFADYLARTQAILQAGTAKIDAAVYIYKYGTYAPVWEDRTLARSGYTYDFVSPNTLSLENAYVENGILGPKGPAYKALIIDNQSYMDVKTAQRILEFAKKGLKIFVIGKMPSEVPYYKDWEKDQEVLAGIVNQLKADRNVISVDNEESIVKAMKAAGINPNAGYAEPSDLITAGREADGMRYYFIFNDGTTDVETDITLKGSGNIYSINLWSGAVTQEADWKINADGTAMKRFRIAPKGFEMVAIGKGRLLDVDGKGHDIAVKRYATVNGDVPGPAAVIVSDGQISLRAFANGEYKVTMGDGKRETVKAEGLPDPYDLSRGWSLDVERWQDDTSTKDIKYDTLKTKIDVGRTDLVSWKQIPGLGKEVTGIGAYRVNFTLPADWSNASGAEIVFNSLHCRGAAIFVNGAKVYLDHLKQKADAGGLLKPGDNEIKVVLYTTLGNQLIAYGTLLGGWTNKKVDYEDYGIIGHVTLRPYVLMKLKGDDK